MADEGVDKAVAFRGDFDLNSATIAGRCRSAVPLSVRTFGW